MRLARESGCQYVQASDAARVVAWWSMGRPEPPNRSRDLLHSPWASCCLGLLSAEWTCAAAGGAMTRSVPSRPGGVCSRDRHTPLRIEALPRRGAIRSGRDRASGGPEYEQKYDAWRVDFVNT